jgi:hypothetical protein
MADEGDRRRSVNKREKDYIRAVRESAVEFIAARRTPCSVCGTPLWRHVEKVAGHEFADSQAEATGGEE